MKPRILLAYSGGLRSSAAVAWLAERHGAEVMTVTVDVGQAENLDEVRARALTCGAVRAHVVDARDAFARDYAIPALRNPGSAALHALQHPLVARTLVEVGAIESATSVAHASPAPTFDEELAAVDPPLHAIAVARDWTMDADGLREYARARHLPVGPAREPHLLVRAARDPRRAPDAEAEVTVAFEAGAPIALNGVAMTLVELIESLSLIGGQHGIGYGEALPAPAAIILGAAYVAAGHSNNTVRLRLHKGACSLLVTPTPELVNHS